MIRGGWFLAAMCATAAVVMWTGGQADAAQCGSGPGGFEAWKRQMRRGGEGKGHRRQSPSAR